VAQACRFSRKVPEVGLEKVLSAQRRLQAEARIDGGIERVDAHKVAALAHAQIPQEVINQTVGLAFSNEVGSGIKVVLFALKGMDIAPWPVMAFNHQDLLACFGQQGRGSQPSHATADDDDVIVFFL
jgi:hypothetical protein